MLHQLAIEAGIGLSSYSILGQSWESENYNSASYTNSSSITIIRVLSCSATAYPSFAQEKKKYIRLICFYSAFFCCKENNKIYLSSEKKSPPFSLSSPSPFYLSLWRALTNNPLEGISQIK